MKTLKDKWALVTGSTRGVGQYIATGLAEHGCNIIVHGRKMMSTAETMAKLKAFDVQTYAVAGDIGTAEGLAAVVAGVEAEPGYVDILYNNAAINNPQDEIWEIPIEDWLTVFNVNLFAMVQLCNAFVPGMVARGYGRIINLTSGIRDQPRLAPYSVSKAAVDKYTLDMAAELQGTNVIVSHLDPGWLKTDMGGAQAPGEVASVLPGALVPALLEEGSPNGKRYAAQDYAG